MLCWLLFFLLLLLLLLMSFQVTAAARHPRLTVRWPNGRWQGYQEYKLELCLPNKRSKYCTTMSQSSDRFQQFWACSETLWSLSGSQTWPTDGHVSVLLDGLLDASRFPGCCACCGCSNWRRLGDALLGVPRELRWAGHRGFSEFRNFMVNLENTQINLKALRYMMVYGCNGNLHAICFI